MLSFDYRGMNIVVYYVIQCGNDDIYDCSFILCLGKAFKQLVKVLLCYFSSKVECFLKKKILIFDTSKLSKFCRTLQTFKLLLVI